MVLVADLGGRIEERALQASQRGADALLVPAELLGNEGGAPAFIRDRQELPWGIWFNKVTLEPSTVKEMGFDFAVLPLQGTTSSFLQQDGLGCIVNIEPSLPDSLLRTLDQLPLDAIMFSYHHGEEELTVEHLMAYQRIGNFVRKPLIIGVSSGVSKDNLALLREVGVEGLLIGGDIDILEEKLSAFRQAIDTLPPSKGVREKRDVVLPILQSVKSPPVEEEEEEEEEDF